MSLKPIINIYKQSASVEAYSSLHTTDVEKSFIGSQEDRVTQNPLQGLAQLQSNIQMVSELQQKLCFLRGEIQEVLNYKKN